MALPVHEWTSAAIVSQDGLTERMRVILYDAEGNETHGVISREMLESLWPPKAQSIVSAPEPEPAPPPVDIPAPDPFAPGSHHMGPVKPPAKPHKKGH